MHIPSKQSFFTMKRAIRVGMRKEVVSLSSEKGSKQKSHVEQKIMTGITS